MEKQGKDLEACGSGENSSCPEAPIAVALLLRTTRNALRSLCTLHHRPPHSLPALSFSAPISSSYLAIIARIHLIF